MDSQRLSINQREITVDPSQSSVSRSFSFTFSSLFLLSAPQLLMHLFPFFVVIVSNGECFIVTPLFSYTFTKRRQLMFHIRQSIYISFQIIFHFFLYSFHELKALTFKNNLFTIFVILEFLYIVSLNYFSL